MIKRKIKETVEEYDADGKLVSKTTTRTKEKDDAPVVRTYMNSPYPSSIWGIPVRGGNSPFPCRGGTGGSAPLEKGGAE